MAQVKLILSEDVIGLGEAGEVVAVKPGYARNYLLPQGKALVATEAKVRELEHHRKIIAEKVEAERGEREADRKRLEKLTLEFEAQAGEGGRLFGSVTAAQIAERLSEHGFEVDRRKVQLSEPIKETGDHEVAVRLHRDVTAKLKVHVEAVGTPAAAEDDEDEDEDEREAAGEPRDEARRDDEDDEARE